MPLCEIRPSLNNQDLLLMYPLSKGRLRAFSQPLHNGIFTSTVLQHIVGPGISLPEIAKRLGESFRGLAGEGGGEMCQVVSARTWPPILLHTEMKHQGGAILSFLSLALLPSPS